MASEQPEGFDVHEYLAGLKESNPEFYEGVMKEVAKQRRNRERREFKRKKKEREIWGS